MAEIDDNTLRQLADAIKNMSKTDMFPRTQDDLNFDVLVKKMDDVEKGNRSETKRMIEAYNKAMKEHGVKTEINDLKGVMQAQNTGKAMKSILTTIMSKDKKTGKLTMDTYREAENTIKSMERQAESAGTTLNDMGIKVTRFYNTKLKKWEIRIADHDKVVKELTIDTAKLSDALEDAADSTEKYSERVSFVKGMLGKFGNAVKVVGKDFIRLAEQEQRFAQQNATADAGWIDGVTKMQISTLDYMKILKATRRESLAANAAGVDFKESLISGTDSLRGLTSSSTEAAMVSKTFHQNMARIGVSQGDLGDAVLRQTKLYEKHYRVLGYSAEEFANLTTELLNDQGMRSTLLSLQEKERRAYIFGIQQRQAEYQTMGYTIERAKELQKTFQALNQMNPKERMKQAAKTRAMMGAMGMGAQGEELFNLQVRYRTMDAEQKKAADLRMTEIQSAAAAKFGTMSGSGTSLGQAMSMQMMAEKTGFLKVAETFETASGEGLKLTKEQLEIATKSAKHTNEISVTSKNLLHAQDAWRAAENTALTSVATNLISGFAELAIINTAGFAATALASRMAGQGLGGGFGANVGKGNLLKSLGAAGIAAAIGVEIGNKITDIWKTENAEGYANFAETLGGMWDNSIFASDEQKERSANLLEAQAFQKQMAEDNKRIKELAEQQLEATNKQTAIQQEGSEKLTEATDKATAVTDAANRNANLPGNRGTS